MLYIILTIKTIPSLIQTYGFILLGRLEVHLDEGREWVLTYTLHMSDIIHDIFISIVSARLTGGTSGLFPKLSGTILLTKHV